MKTHFEFIIFPLCYTAFNIREGIPPLAGLAYMLRSPVP